MRRQLLRLPSRQICRPRGRPRACSQLALQDALACLVDLQRGGAIVGLLVLPLTAPLLIFGTRASDFGLHDEPAAGPLYLLAALAALAVSLGPIAIAAALRVGVE